MFFSLFLFLFDVGCGWCLYFFFSFGWSCWTLVNSDSKRCNWWRKNGTAAVYMYLEDDEHSKNITRVLFGARNVRLVTTLHRTGRKVNQPSFLYSCSDGSLFSVRSFPERWSTYEREQVNMCGVVWCACIYPVRKKRGFHHQVSKLYPQSA